MRVKNTANEYAIRIQRAALAPFETKDAYPFLSLRLSGAGNASPAGARNGLFFNHCRSTVFATSGIPPAFGSATPYSLPPGSNIFERKKRRYLKVPVVMRLRIPAYASRAAAGRYASPLVTKIPGALHLPIGSPMTAVNSQSGPFLYSAFLANPDRLRMGV